VVAVKAVLVALVVCMAKTLGLALGNPLIIFKVARMVAVVVVQALAGQMLLVTAVAVQ
jgi:hypothetical protein